MLCRLRYYQISNRSFNLWLEPIKVGAGVPLSSFTSRFYAGSAC
jgi:hypothetical protein